MSHKATISAPSNIAFIKYWGAKDLGRAIPANPSISMTLEHCRSRTTVEWLAAAGDGQVRWRGGAGALEEAPPDFASRILGQLGNLRRWAEVEGHFRVATENSFPAAAGLASSASGFAALTLATVAALGRSVSEFEASRLARMSGSGSASRSVSGGYVEWPFGPAEDGWAEQIHSADHWQLADVIALVATEPKRTSSLEGHRRARSSPYWRARQGALPDRLEIVRRALEERDLTALGETIEAEAVDLHCVAMTSLPAIFYWQPATLEVLSAVRQLRRDGVEAYSTLDAGPNVHVICRPESATRVARRLAETAGVSQVIEDQVGHGPRSESEHLF